MRGIILLPLMLMCVVACNRNATAPAGTLPLAATVALETGDGYTRGLGEKAGALIEVIRPDDWNGELVLLMPGWTPPNLRPTLRNPFQWQVQPAIDDLLARGFGVALSSYRKTGNAVKEGVIDSRIAESTFASQFGVPTATYLWGWSMGSAIGRLLVEQGAGRYVGFLAACSNMVGPSVTVQYRVDVLSIFDYYFPGALPWELGSGDADLFTEVFPAIQAAFLADPAGYVEKVTKMASIDQLRLPLGSGQAPDVMLTILGATLGIAGGGADLIQTFGGLPVGNADRVYTSDLLSAQELTDLNANVRRYAPDRGAEQRMARLDATGRTHDTPILALHTDGDAVVPVWMPRMYADIAADAGESDRYVLRVVPAFAHCELTTQLGPDGFDEVQIQAFDDLVLWVRNGIVPPS